jgi:FkbM family methyltransferase
MRSYRFIFRLLILIGISLVLVWYFKKMILDDKSDMRKKLLVGSHVHIVDPDLSSLDRNFPCIKTRKILNLYETTICIYSKGDTVSQSVSTEHIWEEMEMTRIIKILIRNPHMDMIDIGANIGGYTMFTAGALGRFTLSIDCYLPNIERIARAVQIQRVQNRVVLVQNAMYSTSGEYLSITIDDPSGIRLINDTRNKNLTSHFHVQSVGFDDLYPILEKHGVRTALIKIDIETSESYMCQTGTKIFDKIDIPFVMMEWHHWRVNHQKRYQSIVDFFTERNYIPTNERCEELHTSGWLKQWSGNVYWIKKIYMNQTFC